jgi:hypothetical protein
MYIEDESYFDDLFTNDIQINVDHLFVGGISELEVESKSIGDNYRAYSSWMPFGFSMDMVTSPPEDLMNWYPWTNNGMATNLLKLNGTDYEGTICVPEFMPINTDYTVIVQIYDLDSVNSIDYYPSPEVGFIVVKPEAAPGSLAEDREESSTGNSGGFRLDLWVLLILIIICILIIVLIVRRRRRNRIQTAEVVERSQPQPQPTVQVNYQMQQISKKFECPQCRTQFVINGYQGQSIPVNCPNCKVQGQIKI